LKNISHFIFYKILGWKIVGDLDPNLLKLVIIVAPHTSWHDFYIGVFTRRLLGIPIHFVAKKELFFPPFGWYFRWMGGTPIDRSKNKNTVAATVEIFNQKKEFRIAIAPEGTRKKTDTWKSGFYYIAVEAQVPIICVSFDYKTKTVAIGSPFYPTGNYQQDLPQLRNFFKDAVGKIPSYTATI